MSYLATSRTLKAVEPQALRSLDNLLYLCDRDGTALLLKSELHAVLDSLDWHGDYDTLWMDLVSQCADAAVERGAVKACDDLSHVNAVSKGELGALYAAPAYQIERAAREASHEIIDRLRGLYERVAPIKTDLEGAALDELARIIGEATGLALDAKDLLARAAGPRAAARLTFEMLCSCVLGMDIGSRGGGAEHGRRSWFLGAPHGS